ncbi:hypothetical protein L596_024324 [Steinernema carpocapsae]|uniref:Uncharacterized protein n=1 Tax=Steinernema carpocapsae TaxID=34508 RepID=A0A4U5MGF2_STECR|nr:hypothetical protein L596_024324 [Steinernema carpocapsae]
MRLIGVGIHTEAAVTGRRLISAVSCFLLFHNLFSGVFIVRILEYFRVARSCEGCVLSWGFFEDSVEIPCEAP